MNDDDDIDADFMGDDDMVAGDDSMAEENYKSTERPLVALPDGGADDAARTAKITRMVRGHASDVLALLAQELAGAPSSVRVLGMVESYAAAQRGFLADIEEPTLTKKRKRAYVAGGGAMFANPPGYGENAMIDQLGGFLDKLVAVQTKSGAPTPAQETMRLADTLKTLDGVEGMEDVRANLRAKLRTLTGASGAPAEDGPTIVDIGTLPQAPAAKAPAPAAPAALVKVVDVLAAGAEDSLD